MPRRAASHPAGTGRAQIRLSIAPNQATRQVTPRHSTTSGRFWAASEPDARRRLQSYSRYRVLWIAPVFLRSFNDERRYC